MKITVMAVGKLRETYLKEALQFYSKRIGRKHELVMREIPDQSESAKAGEAEAERIRIIEGKKIIGALPPNAAVIILDVQGKRFSRRELASKLGKLSREKNGHLVFIIGGSRGLSEEVKARGNLSVSFSPMTFPHQLSRIILLEQLDRLT